MDDPQRWGGCSPADRIVNLYQGWLAQLAGILRALGMDGVSELRGRSDLLVYLE
jgi:glutamate synthase domain-containing protein 2